MNAETNLERLPHLHGDWIELPDALLYFEADFLAAQGYVDHDLFDHLAQSLHWTQDRIVVYGREVQIPRLNAWYGDAGTDYAYSGLRLQPRPWLPVLDDLRQKLSAHLQHRFNSVLANFYRDGSDSVGRHADDEPELGPLPMIATISLGASRRFALHPKNESPKSESPENHSPKNNSRGQPWRADLPGGSLFVMAGRCQRAWQHEIPKTAKPVGGRISLTYRQVVKANR